MNWTLLSQATGAIFLVALSSIRVHAQLDLDQIQTQLPEQLVKTNLSYADVKDSVRNKCIQVAGEEAGSQAFAEIETGFMHLTDCANHLVNYTAIQQEIQEASPKGELDVVFNKYCTRRSEAVECFDQFTAKLSPCLVKDEQEGQEVIKRIIESLLNFVCHKDGDQIALFIAEKGPECLASQKENIEQCVNNTFGPYLNFSGGLQDNQIKSIPMLTVGQKECDDMLVLQACVVSKLEQCTDITPANLVESMFNFIRNQTLCRNYQKSPLVAAAAGGGDGLQSNAVNVLYLAVYFLFAVIFSIKKSP
ncbi:27 kDa hemolymph protein [Drosophila kikkawai]|uniref:27 kDa hemolymph protein n=1 Tax=Drosophila kikkawai TaxID=30033 RepID=A0A6P4JJZ1_DROKI|nr:27 kDa hemolymph protein [Drosophila kikkawai]